MFLLSFCPYLFGLFLPYTVHLQRSYQTVKTQSPQSPRISSLAGNDLNSDGFRTLVSVTQNGKRGSFLIVCFKAHNLWFTLELSIYAISILHRNIILGAATFSYLFLIFIWSWLINFMRNSSRGNVFETETPLIKTIFSCSHTAGFLELLKVESRCIFIVQHTKPLLKKTRSIWVRNLVSADERCSRGSAPWSYSVFGWNPRVLLGHSAGAVPALAASPQERVCPLCWPLSEKPEKMLWSGKAVSVCNQLAAVGVFFFFKCKTMNFLLMSISISLHHHGFTFIGGIYIKIKCFR